MKLLHISGHHKERNGQSGTSSQKRDKDDQEAKNKSFIRDTFSLEERQLRHNL